MIWDASDANPMHRRLPAEVVSRRRAEKKPKAPEATTDEVVVDLKTAITLKPEARTKWLSKACAMVEQGKAKPTDLYDIVTNRKFSGGLPDRVGRKLASIIRDSFSIFSDKQQRYLNSTESPVPMHLAAQEDEEAAEEEAPRRPKRAPREEAPATATIPEITLKESDNKAASRKEKPPPPGPVVEAPRPPPAENREDEARRRKLEEEADNILGALVPGLADAAPPIFSKADANRGRSVSGGRSIGSRSISSRTARRRAREQKTRKGRDRDGSWRSGGSGLSGSRALLLNRNYTEDPQSMVHCGPAAHAAECSDFRQYDLSASCRQLTSSNLYSGDGTVTALFFAKAGAGGAGTGKVALEVPSPETLSVGRRRGFQWSEGWSEDIVTWCFGPVQCLRWEFALDFCASEQVLYLWSDPPNGVSKYIGWTTDELYVLGDMRWEKTIFKKENPDGTLALRPCKNYIRNLDNVDRELVRRYPYGGRPPELSGITLGQLRRLYAAHKDWMEEPKWNEFARQMQRPTMYDIVPAIIKPATKHTQGSYVELFTQKAVDVFVSHWWGGEFVEFVASLASSAAQLLRDDVGGLYSQRCRSFGGQSGASSQQQQDAAESMVFWICSFANAQWTVNLGNSLEESPFEVALASKTCKAVVMVMDELAMPLTRIWCIYEVLRTGVLRHPFYVATQHGVLVGERVRESPRLAASLLSLAERLSDLRPQHAAASNLQDRDTIISEVSNAVGVEQFALAVQASLFEVLRKAGYALYSRNWRLNFKLLQLHREAVREVYWLQPGTNPNSNRRERRRPATDSSPQRTVLHRAAQEGDMEILQQESVEDKVRSEKATAAFQELQVMMRNGASYQEREQKKDEVRGLKDEVMDREDELGQKALHLAARYCRDLEALQLVVQHWPSHAKHRDKFGRLPLHRAAESGCAETLAALLPLYAGGALVQELDKQQHSCLDLAVLSGSTEAVNFLLQKRAILEHGNKRTPLHLAAQWNHVGPLQDLAALGFLETGDSDGTRPLHLAARFGHEEAVKALLGLGADVAATTVFGRTSLHWAALNGHAKMTALLLESRSPPDERDGAGWTAFHWAIRRGHDDCARALREGGADIHRQDLRSRRNALHIAAAADASPDLLEDLAGWGVNLLETDVGQKVPLHLAAQWGKLRNIGKLLEMKSDVEARCSHQRTALHLAARRGHASLCTKLVEEGGADINAADATGSTPFALACRFGHFDVVFAMAERRVDLTNTEKGGMTALHWAAHFGKTAVVRQLVGLHADVAAATRYGRHPLHCAAIEGKKEAVEALIKLRSNVHHPQKDGWLPIHLASRYKHVSVVMALIEHRADPNSKGVNGKTPAQLCAQQNGCFSDVGFDKLQQDESGRNALHTAAIHGSESWFYGLARRNPAGVQLIFGLATPDAQGRTPLHLAAAFGRHLVVQEILRTFLDENGSFNRCWHRVKPRGFYNKLDDEEDDDSSEPPPLPVLTPDRRGRLPLHAAAVAGFPAVVGQLVSFMLEKLDCSVADILRPDDEGASALDLACRRRDDAAARRLSEKLGVELPLSSRGRTPPSTGDEVCLKRALQLEHRSLSKGTLGRVEAASESAVKLEFPKAVGHHGLTMTEFFLHCATKQRYIVNYSHLKSTRGRRRSFRLGKRREMPESPQHLDDDSSCSEHVEEGAVVEGFDLGDAWLQLCEGGWLPTHIQLRSSRRLPVLSAWNGPPINIGDVVTTVKELVLWAGRVLKPDSVGIVLRINSKEVLLKIEAAKGGGCTVSLTDTVFVKHVQVTGCRCLMKEPMGAPPEGTLVTHREHGCGVVQHIEKTSHNGTSRGFSVLFGDGTRSQLPADRRGIRLIRTPPTPQEVAAYFLKKEQILRRKNHPSSAVQTGTCQSAHLDPGN
ncbi:ANK1 [Symbiodinium sp. CCMP2592]|nr:ANK1 [Symbiodinium sp. CCMP2592]